MLFGLVAGFLRVVFLLGSAIDIGESITEVVQIRGSGVDRLKMAGIVPCQL